MLVVEVVCYCVSVVRWYYWCDGTYLQVLAHTFSMTFYRPLLAYSTFSSPTQFPPTILILLPVILCDTHPLPLPPVHSVFHPPTTCYNRSSIFFPAAVYLQPPTQSTFMHHSTRSMHRHSIRALSFHASSTKPCATHHTGAFYDLSENFDVTFHIGGALIFIGGLVSIALHCTPPSPW